MLGNSQGVLGKHTLFKSVILHDEAKSYCFPESCVPQKLSLYLQFFTVIFFASTWSEENIKAKPLYVTKNKEDRVAG